MNPDASMMMKMRSAIVRERTIPSTDEIIDHFTNFGILDLLEGRIELVLLFRETELENSFLNLVMVSLVKTSSTGRIHQE